MPWKLVRLEHAPSSAFPDGSAVRAYLLRIPLQSNGHIDRDFHASDPRLSTVRRFWPSEPDRSGYIVREDQRWQLVTTINVSTREKFGWFEDRAFVPAAEVPITEPANGTIRFRVADIRTD